MHAAILGPLLRVIDTLEVPLQLSFFLPAHFFCLLTLLFPF